MSVSFPIFYFLTNQFTTGTLHKIQGAICKHIPALQRQRENKDKELFHRQACHFIRYKVHQEQLPEVEFMESHVQAFKHLKTQKVRLCSQG